MRVVTRPTSPAIMPNKINKISLATMNIGRMFLLMIKWKQHGKMKANRELPTEPDNAEI